MRPSRGIEVQYEPNACIKSVVGHRRSSVMSEKRSIGALGIVSTIQA